MTETAPLKYQTPSGPSTIDLLRYKEARIQVAGQSRKFSSSVKEIYYLNFFSTMSLPLSNGTYLVKNIRKGQYLTLDDAVVGKVVVVADKKTGADLDKQRVW